MKETTKAGIDEFVQYGQPLGDFLTAVLQNNLVEAIGRADEENQRDIVEIVGYLYWEIPSSCWGSPEKVAKWIAQGGLEGQKGVANGAVIEPADVPARS